MKTGEMANLKKAHPKPALFKKVSAFLILLSLFSASYSFAFDDPTGCVHDLSSHFSPDVKRRFLEDFQKQHPPLHAREAQSTDLPELQALINRVRGEFIHQGEQLKVVFDEDLVNMDSIFKNDESALFVITDSNGKIIGSGGFASTGNLDGKLEVELRKIYFDPSLRGQNLGKKWVQSLVQLAKNLGNDSMWLINHKLLSRATQIYRDLGFVDFQPSAEQSHGLAQSDYWFLKLNLENRI